MYIVTTVAEGERAGCLVGFASQASIEPPRFTVWLSELNRTARVAARASTMVVHVLRDGDRPLALLFGGATGDDGDKFELVAHEDGPDGVPVLTQCDWFAGKVVARLEGAGDHTAYVLEPFAGERRHAGLPNLGYQHVSDVNAGHPPDELADAG
jgi:flavin reductase (DIM6/NTAB) family NADH-FMN oxidoreductase RutF